MQLAMKTIQPESRAPWRALVVTMFPERFASIKATVDVVSSASVGLDFSTSNNYDAIFCDMGALAPQESGFRFAAGLKRAGNTAPLYLMVESISTVDRLWVQRNGCKDLICRRADALIAAVDAHLAGQQHATTHSGKVADDSNAQFTPQFITRLKSALRAYIGPAAGGVVEKAVDSLNGRPKDEGSVSLVVRAVANYIDDSAERERFLFDAKSLEQK